MESTKEGREGGRQEAMKVEGDSDPGPPSEPGGVW